MNKLSPREIANALNARAEEVCLKLLPAGKREGIHWSVSYTMDKEGSSLKIPLSGEKQGLWGCFNTAAWPHRERGDMLNLWQVVRGCNIATAIMEAKAFLGIHEGTGQLKQYKPGKGQSKIDVGLLTLPPGSRLIEMGSKAYEYLHNERGIELGIMELYKLQTCKLWMPMHKADVWTIIFPVYAENGESLLMWKAIAIDRIRRDDGTYKKDMRTNKGTVHHLFGMHTIDKDKGTIVVCEGEIDALSVRQGTGDNAVSVPFGTASDKWLDNDWDWLEAWKDLVVAYDNDEAGAAAGPPVLKRLGVERSRLLEWPEDGDDANTVLLRDVESMPGYVDGAAPIDPECLRRPLYFYDTVFEKLYPSGGEEPGIAPPWNLPFRFRGGELTIWTGYNKHGKTVCLEHCLIDFAARGEYSMIASLEMPAPVTLANMYRQASGQRRHFNNEGEPDIAMYQHVMNWLNTRFLIYDHVGVARVEEILEAAKYSVRRHGVKHIVIDSLMRMEVSETDYDAQKYLLNRLTEFAEHYDCHVHLVAHSRKPGDKRSEDRHPPRKYDINGGACLSNIPHNIICVFRDKRKENELANLELLRAAGREVDQAEYDKWDSRPDAQFLVLGQRLTGMEPLKGLWFDKGESSSWQFFDRPNYQVVNYTEQ